MSLSDLNKKTLIENLIKDKIKTKQSIDTETLATEIEELLEETDLTTSQFDSADFLVEAGETSSATKLTNTFKSIQDDLSIAYQQLAELGEDLTVQAYRQQLELEGLERALLELESKVNEVYYATQENRKVYIWEDNFANGEKITFSDNSISGDTIFSNIFYDFKSKQITLVPTSSDRIFLDNINETEDVSFNVLTKTGFLNRIDNQNQKLVNIVKQENIFWQTKLSFTRSIPITAELFIKISDELTTLNKIYIAPLSLLASSDLIITPLYSVDNINYYQLPGSTISKTIAHPTAFHFKAVEVKYLKFLLTKTGPDKKENNNYIYEFGFKNIELSNNIYPVDTVQQLISTKIDFIDPMAYIPESIKYKKVFSTFELECCSEIPTNTFLNFSVLPFEEKIYIDNDNSRIELTPDSEQQQKFHPISLLQKEEFVFTSSGTIDCIISERDSSETFVTENQNYSTHYWEFDPIQTLASGYLYEVENKKPRYSLLNSEDRILNHEFRTSFVLETDIDINNIPYMAFSKIEIFRNIGEKSLSASANTSYVRGSLRGWRYENPYYSTIIYVNNPNGLEIDFGSESVIIDDKEYNGKVSNTILTGRTSLLTGIHEIKIHEKNWQYVEGTETFTTEAEFEEADSLYPYNHKYLIEGFDKQYSAPTVYNGVDIFAEYYMTEIDVYNFLYNIPFNAYQYFTIDRGNLLGRNYNNVIVLKINENNIDYLNEVFRIKLISPIRSGNTESGRKKLNLKTTARLMIEFSTEDETTTPVLEGYKVIMEALN